MPNLYVIRHEIRKGEVASGEEYDPSTDLLTVVHKNPEDPDDPTEFGHHIRLQGIAYRKEIWGLDEYSDAIDLELKDLERYYFRQDGIDYGPHPVADVTSHYYNGPARRMRSFAPDYLIDRAVRSARMATPGGMQKMYVDAALMGIDDVRACLRAKSEMVFPCRSMTSLSVDTIAKRSSCMSKMAEQTQQISLVPSEPLDRVRQMLTDRSSELEQSREAFVNHAIMEANVPEIIRGRVAEVASKRGFR